MTQMRIIQPAEMPNGQAGLLIECTCRTHPQGKAQAIVRADFRTNMEADPERIHGHVTALWHPVVGPTLIRRGTYAKP